MLRIGIRFMICSDLHREENASLRETVVVALRHQLLRPYNHLPRDNVGDRRCSEVLIPLPATTRTSD